MNDELPAVTLARIEGKLDLLNAAIVRGDSRGDDHEARLRALEQKNYVSAKAMWSGIGVLAAACSAAAPFLAQLYGG